MTRELRSVGVVGLGTMGAGIAEVVARGGMEVCAVEIDEAALERGRSALIGSVDRALARGRLSPEQREDLLGRIRFEVGLPALGEVDLVVEAVPERVDLKRRLFTELDRVCRPDAVLATNTSSLSVTEVAAATGRPERVVGVHFFNPAPVMKLVEVVHTVVTADEVVTAVASLCERLGKVVVRVGDRAGFVANALLFGYLNDAVAMVDTGYASREDIDTVMRLGCGLPMGPLTLLDLIGLDTAVQILGTLYRRGGRDRRHAPSPLLRHLVAAGLLGRKSGRGFYTYERPGSPVVVPDELTPPPALGGDARRVATIGMLADDSASHDPLVEVFAKGGYEVVTATEEAPAPLAAADLVLAPSGPDAATTGVRFAALGGVCRPDAVLAATGPEVAVIDCAMAAGRPSDVVGLHLLNGAVAEIVHTVRTSSRAVATARAVVAGAGLTGVVCPDRAGFVARALLLPHLNDAVRMLESGYATVADIDTAMTLGCAYPSGPFAMLDDLGLDVAVRGLRAIYRQRREPGVAPAPLLEQLVTAGWTGHGAGRGFRDHASG